MALYNTEKTIEALESSLSLDQPDDHLAQRTIQTKRKRNSLVPINQLPVELLISIFQTLLFWTHRYYRYESHLSELKAISSVSWWWNTIIMDAAVLWAVIESSTPTDLLPVILRRSKDCPLEITLQELNNRNRDHQLLLETAFSNINRWKKVSIDLKTAPENRRKRLEHPAPTIEALDLKIHEPWPGPQINLFQGHAPNLTTLQIQGLPVRWSSGIFHGLRKIVIRSILENGPTTTEILDAFRCSPLLQHLELSAVSMPSTPPPRPTSPVQLQHLKSLRLTMLPSSAIQDTLAQIRAPSLLELIVDPDPIDPNYHLTTYFNIAFRHFLPFISSCVKRARQVRLGVAPYNANLYVRTRPRSGKKYFRIHLDHTPIMAGLKMCDSLFLAHATPLPSISLMVDNVEDVPESEFLWMFDHEINDRVTEVDLRRMADSSFLSSLCTGRKVGGIWKWPFPRLRRLALPHALESEQAVSLIRQRYAPTSADFPKDLVPYSRDATFELVDRLKCLNVMGIALMPNHHSYLANIVGDDVLEISDWCPDYLGLDDEV
ncbi:hypothetical protein FRC04_004933 [Tulasnella sp. 424]|nr:hypothetical protein FRC04_004933 [Tulasnella sp. 424]